MQKKKKENRKKKRKKERTWFLKSESNFFFSNQSINKRRLAHIRPAQDCKLGSIIFGTILSPIATLNKLHFLKQLEFYIQRFVRLEVWNREGKGEMEMNRACIWIRNMDLDLGYFLLV